MRKKRSFVIGISGPSSSGKTTISKILAKKLKAQLIHLDDYWKYHGEKIPSRKEWKKWEHPSSMDYERLLEEIIRIFKIKQSPFIIVEGFHMFYDKNIRGILDLKIYSTIPNSLIVKRRLERFGFGDNQEEYSKNIVTKSYKKYGEPTKKYADLIINGTENINENVERILGAIKKLKQESY